MDFFLLVESGGILSGVFFNMFGFQGVFLCATFSDAAVEWFALILFVSWSLLLLLL